MSSQDITTSAEKQCTKCQQTKPLEEFPIEPRSKNGYQSQCYGCFREKQKARRAKIRKNAAETETPAIEIAAAKKRCPGCKLVLSISHFPRNRSNHDGLHSYCRTCNKVNCRTFHQQWKTGQPKKEKTSPPIEKECSECKRMLSVSAFAHSRRTSDGLLDECKACQFTRGRSRAIGENRRRNYGITPEEYAAKLEAQQGRCAICRRLPGKKALAVDHDHKPGGEVRELLCVTCNLGIGYFRDDITLLEKAIEYLRSHAEHDSADSD